MPADENASVEGQQDADRPEPPTFETALSRLDRSHTVFFSEASQPFEKFATDRIIVGDAINNLLFLCRRS